MDILSFSRMKVFYKDGRARVILKLRLPRVCSELVDASEFNKFYEALADEYISLLCEVAHSAEIGSRPTTVAVDFSVITDEYMKEYPKARKKYGSAAIIRRDVKINRNGEMHRFSKTDIYNTKVHMFVK